MTTRPEITLTHLDEAGAAYMVDVTAKTPTVREAKVVAKSGGRSGDWVRGDRGDRGDVA